MKRVALAIFVAVLACGMFVVGVAAGQSEKPTISSELKESIQFRFNRREVLARRYKDLEAEYQKRVAEIDEEYQKLGVELKEKVDAAYVAASVTAENFDFNVESAEFVSKIHQKPEKESK